MKHLTQEDFKTTIQSEKPVLVDFWAPWCGPCQMMGPVFESVSKEFEGIDFAKVNVDVHQEIAGSVGIRGIPALVLFKDGKEVDRITGFLPEEQLKARIAFMV